MFGPIPQRVFEVTRSIETVVLDQVQPIRDEANAVRRIGRADLRALRSFWNPDGLRRTLGVLGQLMRRRGVAVILVETTAGGRGATGSPDGAIRFAEPGHGVPSCVDFAEVSVEVSIEPARHVGDTPRAHLVITDLRDGTTHEG